jgi:hypothetical protein
MGQLGVGGAEYLGIVRINGVRKSSSSQIQVKGKKAVIIVN